MYNNYYPYNSFNIKPKFNWSNLLNTTGKTLNVINQAIPVFYQIKPILGNAKTLFKVMGAMKDDPKEEVNTYNDLKPTNNNVQNPKLFI
ncbi:MAG: hypothetical protein RR359_04725 [Bacilli bacterium]